MTKSIIARIAGIVSLIAVIALGLVFLPVKESLTQFLQWVEGTGMWGPVVLAAAYTPACVLCLPGAILTLGGGFLFGVVKGTIASSLGSVVGATAAFLVGRTLARKIVEERMSHFPTVRALDHAVAEQGLKLILLIRLSPMFPFNVLNYAFSLTKVRLRDYILGSWIGMFPGTVMYVYLGSAAHSLADLATGTFEGGTAQKTLFFVGLVATVAVTISVTRIAKKALDKAIEHERDAIASQSRPAYEAV